MTNHAKRGGQGPDWMQAGTTSRRAFLRGLGLAGAATVLPRAPAESMAQPDRSPPAIPGLLETGSGARSITLNVNGSAHTITVEPRATLLHTLREVLHLTGAKSGCDRGACGACNVLVNQRAVSSCCLLAVEAEGAEIWTIEGLASSPAYAPLIDAFCKHDAAQCGYCIPGMVIGAAALLHETPRPSREDIKTGLAGHLCRCAAHEHIVDAVYAASRGGITT